MLDPSFQDFISRFHYLVPLVDYGKDVVARSTGMTQYIYMLC
jgi:hypothetical protein